MIACTGKQHILLSAIRYMEVAILSGIELEGACSSDGFIYIICVCGRIRGKENCYIATKLSSCSYSAGFISMLNSEKSEWPQVQQKHLKVRCKVAYG